MIWKRQKPPPAPAWLIVGLGNPGAEYRGTRHNVGWEVIDELVEQYKVKMERTRHRARVGHAQIEDLPVLLVKPLTYMNLSGQAVAPLMRESSLTPAHVLVIADDKDLAFGKLRLKLRGSPGGHNGHKSLVHSLRTQDYPRFKLGIGSGEADTIEHVLSPFTREERLVMNKKVASCAEAVIAFVTKGESAALGILESENRAEP